MKHRIFTTYGETPIKNVKTPIRRFDGDPEEEDIIATPSVPVYTETEDATVELLEQIRALLVVIIVIKIVCLCIKH